MSNKYLAYPQYIDSGFAWLGSVPKHWVVKKISHVAFLQSGDSISSEDIAENGQFPVYGGNGFRGYTKAFTHHGFYILIGRQGALCGNINYGDGFFWASEHAIVVHPHIPVHVRWLGETLRAMNLNQYNVSAAQPGLAVSNITCLKIPFPPIEEQRQISYFLDHETAKIDTLIEKQQQLIKLLKEKRLAVISHAVTKGLDPDAPMKDSGVEWLGEVPEHWSVVTLSSLAKKITNGYVGPTRDIFHEEGVRYLQSLHIKNNNINFHTPYYVSEKWSNEKSKSILKEGDVLVVQTGDIGQVSAVTKDFEGCNCHALIIISPNHELNGFYLSWVLSSDYGFHSLKSIQTGALHPHLNCNYVKTIKTPLPPRKEQEKINNYVKKYNSKYETLISKANEQIVLLKERRSALISAAVTGKIDVRNWKPQSATDMLQETTTEPVTTPAAH